MSTKPTDHRDFLKPLPPGVPPEALEPGLYLLGPDAGGARMIAVVELHLVEAGAAGKAMLELHRAVMRGKADRFVPPGEEAANAAAP